MNPAQVSKLGKIGWGGECQLLRFTTRLGLTHSILLGRAFRNKRSNDMSFPHPQSRKDHDRKKDKPGCGGVVRKFFKRTIDVADYRNAEDDVNPAKNRTLGGTIHGVSASCLFCDPLDPRLLSRLRRPVGCFNTVLLSSGSVSSRKPTAWFLFIATPPQ